MQHKAKSGAPKPGTHKMTAPLPPAKPLRQSPPQPSAPPPDALQKMSQTAQSASQDQNLPPLVREQFKRAMTKAQNAQALSDVLKRRQDKQETFQKDAQQAKPIAEAPGEPGGPIKAVSQ